MRGVNVVNKIDVGIAGFPMYFVVMRLPKETCVLQLKEAFPEIFQEKSMEPPPKKKFRFVNNSDKLLEARRKGLEQWLWKLLRFPEVAQSRDMKLFLQLDLAIRAVNIG